MPPTTAEAIAAPTTSAPSTPNACQQHVLYVVEAQDLGNLTLNFVLPQYANEKHSHGQIPPGW